MSDDVADLIEKIKTYPNAQHQYNTILKLSAQIFSSLNQLREKIILESAEISEEKESLIAKSDEYKKELHQNLVINYLIKYFSIEDNIKTEVLKEYKAELIKIARLLSKVSTYSEHAHFRFIEEEIRLVKEQQRLNEKIVQDLYFPKEKTIYENAYKEIYSAPSLKLFTSPEEAKLAVVQLSQQVTSRNDLITQAQQTGDWSALKTDQSMQHKQVILAGLMDPNNNAYFNTEQGSTIKRELQIGLTLADFNQRLGAWDRADTQKREARENEKLIASVQNVYDMFKSELATDFKVLNKSTNPEDNQKAEKIKAQFFEMQNVTDILKFPQGEKYRVCLEKIYDLDKPDEKGQYQLKAQYQSIENSKSVKHFGATELDRRSTVETSVLEVKNNNPNPVSDYWEEIDIFTHGDLFIAAKAEIDKSRFLKPEEIKLSVDTIEKSKPGVLKQFDAMKLKRQNSQDNVSFIPGFELKAEISAKRANHYLRLCEKNLVPILSVPLEQDDLSSRENKIFHVLYQAHMKQNKHTPITPKDDAYLQKLAKELATDKNSVERIQTLLANQSPGHKEIQKINVKKLQN